MGVLSEETPAITAIFIETDKLPAEFDPVIVYLVEEISSEGVPEMMHVVWLILKPLGRLGEIVQDVSPTSFRSGVRGLIFSPFKRLKGEPKYSILFGTFEIEVIASTNWDLTQYSALAGSSPVVAVLQPESSIQRERYNIPYRDFFIFN